MAELTGIERWLAKTLKDDAALTGLVNGRVHNEFVPNPGAGTLPAIVFALLAPADKMVVNRIRFMVTGTYIVKAIGLDASYPAIESIADRIDALLHRASGTVAGSPGTTIISATRTAPFKLMDTENPQSPHAQLGGVYLIEASQP